MSARKRTVADHDDEDDDAGFGGGEGEELFGEGAIGAEHPWAELLRGRAGYFNPLVNGNLHAHRFAIDENRADGNARFHRLQPGNYRGGGGERRGRFLAEKIDAGRGDRRARSRRSRSMTRAQPCATACATGSVSSTSTPGRRR